MAKDHLRQSCNQSPPSPDNECKLDEEMEGIDSNYTPLVVPHQAQKQELHPTQSSLYDQSAQQPKVQMTHPFSYGHQSAQQPEVQTTHPFSYG